MANGKDRDYVSFWFWFMALFVTALPCIGLVFVIIWAFVGDNESRKNYFRAVLAWMLVAVVMWAALMMLGLLPVLYQALEKELK